MNGKIFIIEDEASIIQLVQHNLEKEGFIVSSSVNGNDGLKELKNFNQTYCYWIGCCLIFQE